MCPIYNEFVPETLPHETQQTPLHTIGEHQQTLSESDDVVLVSCSPGNKHSQAAHQLRMLLLTKFSNRVEIIILIKRSFLSATVGKELGGGRRKNKRTLVPVSQFKFHPMLAHVFDKRRQLRFCFAVHASVLGHTTKHARVVKLSIFGPSICGCCLA